MACRQRAGRRRLARAALFVLAILVAAALPSIAGRPRETPSPADLPFVPAWIPQDALADDTRDEVLRGVEGQQPNPEHIFVLIHGWLNNRATSTASFAPAAKTIRSLFEERGRRVAVVGLQWDSYVGGVHTYLPQIMAAKLGLAKNPYVAKVRLARRIGRHAARQLIFALKEQYPEAQIHILAHSMGCEVTGYCVGTRLRAKDPDPAYRADWPLGLSLVCLAGSDLDSGVINDSQIDERTVQFMPRLTWVTIPRLHEGQQDNVLALHSIERGQAAMGNSMPRLKEKQLDLLIGGLRLFYDNEEIPPAHDFPLYYTQKRLTRLVDAIFHMEDPLRHRSPDLESLEAVRAFPDDKGELMLHLNDASLAVRFFVLWRLEKLICGGEAVHMADGSLASLGLQMYRDPEEATKLLPRHPCPMVRAGLFPTQSMWEQAQALAQKRNRQ